MRSTIMMILWAGSLSGAAGAWAQTFIDANEKTPVGPPTAHATGPNGAKYYPGIGYRYVLPPSERIYGYHAGSRVYGYQARRYRGSCERWNFWFWDRARRCDYRG